MGRLWVIASGLVLAAVVTVTAFVVDSVVFATKCKRVVDRETHRLAA